MRHRRRLGSRPQIGIAVDGISHYGRAVMRGVMRYANLRRNWLINQELRRIDARELNWPPCDGAVFAGVMPSVLRRLLPKIPHVVHCSSSGDPERTVVVCLDDVAAGRIAADHLMDCRLERFGFYGHRPEAASLTSRDRLAGFESRLAERRFRCEVTPVGYPAEPERLKRVHWPQLTKWLAELPKPLGIFCYDDTAAHDLAAACLKADIAVPEQVAIIGVNNDELACESAWPPLSSVEGEFSRVGYRAGELLDKLLRGERIPSEERMTRLPPLGVVARQSTDVLAVDDPNLANALRFIREHACDPCTVSDVLAQVPVNRRWLERRFVQTLGRSPHAEISRVRMDRACRLMLNPALSLNEVAEKCGYSAISSFNRAFSEEIGTPPSRYRRQARATVVRGA